jgi:hypothetical protein
MFVNDKKASPMPCDLCFFRVSGQAKIWLIFEFSKKNPAYVLFCLNFGQCYKSQNLSFSGYHDGYSSDQANFD